MGGSVSYQSPSACRYWLITSERRRQPHFSGTQASCPRDPTISISPDLELEVNMSLLTQLFMWVLLPAELLPPPWRFLSFYFLILISRQELM